MLIVGNGVSRLAYQEEIQNFDGDIWICNLAYKEKWLVEIATRWSGHEDLIGKIKKIKEKNQYKFEIWANDNKADKKFNFTCYDTGTTIAKQSLIEGYDIYCVGFDLGGADIYSSKHHLQNKTMWVRRWRELADKFGFERIHWIGQDHTKILKNKRYSEYYHIYKLGQSHIRNEKYKELLEKYT